MLGLPTSSSCLLNITMVRETICRKIQVHSATPCSLSRLSKSRFPASSWNEYVTLVEARKAQKVKRKYNNLQVLPQGEKDIRKNSKK
jgi:hypothetical protein